MVFDSLSFLIFFLIFLLAFWLARKSQSGKLAVVLIADVVFYCSWDWRIVPLLFAIAALDFYGAKKLANCRGRDRRYLFWFLLAANVGPIFLFKLKGLSVSELLYPVGFTFFTLQCLSHVIDSQRGHDMPEASLGEFLASSLFFPRLVAGPVMRSTQVLPQMRGLSAAEEPAVYEALFFVSSGLFVKALGDLLEPYANVVFNNSSGDLSGTVMWTGVIAYMGQLYGQFAGYVSIAIGLALLVGVRMPPNFNLPFLARSVPDYWRRWHITVSAWVFDYIYVPMAITLKRLKFSGGAPFAVIVTFLLMGMLQGAKGTFLVYGAYCGILFLLAYGAAAILPASLRMKPGRLSLTVKIIRTYLLFVPWFIFFRSDSLGNSRRIFIGLFRRVSFSGAEVMKLASVIAIITVLYAASFLLAKHEKKIVARPLVTAALSGILFAFGLAAVGGEVPFVYLHF